MHSCHSTLTGGTPGQWPDHTPMSSTFFIISHMGPKHKAKLAKLQTTCERLQPQWQRGGGRLSGCRPTGAEARSYYSCLLLSMPDMSSHAVIFD